MPIDLLFLLGAAAMFSIGLMLLLTRRNAVAALLGVELMLNAAALNLIAATFRHPEWWEAHVFILFLMVVAVAEAAVGLTIILRLYRRFRSVNVDASF
ncbi:MAG: NADH-quinone oxidoreductase subunit NuoK [Bernardetiaceae bacterium]|nr:NADH-quinone oxidoreductase subunit NuoK [Bernardetiaceae bacterium]